MGQSQKEDIIVQYYTIETNTWEVIEEPDQGPYDVPISAANNNNMVYILGGQAPTEHRWASFLYFEGESCLATCSLLPYF